MENTAFNIEYKPRTGSEAMCEALLDEGVEYMFGYPGGAIMPFYDALPDYPLKHVLVRHEQAAAHRRPGDEGGQGARDLGEGVDVDQLAGDERHVGAVAEADRIGGEFTCSFGQVGGGRGRELAQQGVGGEQIVTGRVRAELGEPGGG